MCPAFELNLPPSLDWDETPSVLAAATEVFDRLSSDLNGLLALVRAVPEDPNLAEMCERYDFLDKLVLHNDVAANVRLRLHMYRPGYFERPHNHRWTFASRILRGVYEHRFFGDDASFGESTAAESLKPILCRKEGPGSTYALHHTSVHTVQAEAGTMSLLLRGPAEKQRFLILDAVERSSFEVVGAADESAETRRQKIMPRETLLEVVENACAVLEGIAWFGSRAGDD